MKILNYEELMADLGSKLEALGYERIEALCTPESQMNGKSDRYICYANTEVQIVIDNNYTSYFWIYFYRLGDYKPSIS